MDLVGTCPKTFWTEWLAEGDCAGEPDCEEYYSWNTRSPLAKQIKVGDRFYVVAHGRLRGYATVTIVYINDWGSWAKGSRYEIWRGGGAVACTIDEPIKGFQGLRKRWWKREAEKPFKDWRQP